MDKSDSEYLKNTDIQTITIEDDFIYMTIKGSNIKMIIDKDDRRFIPIEILNFHAIDPRERQLLFRVANQCRTIFDIGANIGWYTLNFAKLPKVSKVFSFEPIPHTYHYLKKHLEINKIRNVFPFNLGFFDSIGSKTFYWTKNETGSASLENIQERSHINKVDCKVSTLDHFTKDKPDKIDLIKCDVEGAELFVFKGAMKTITRDKPIIFSEMLRKWSKKFQYHPDDIIKLLTNVGYRCFGYIGNEIEEIHSICPDLETTNFFFFHENEHLDIIRDITCPSVN
ncbi:methyltransferase, FkbM family domain protein [Olavius sp. associated proteobacterium Delta 1]|nr:methyltransferase, FkbM family domain protein [Olavius sp. associated proteobacterium Delta 1]